MSIFLHLNSLLHATAFKMEIILIYIYTCDCGFLKFILNTKMKTFCKSYHRLIALYSFYFYEVVLSKFEIASWWYLFCTRKHFYLGLLNSRGVGQITSNVVTFSIDVTMMIFLFLIIALVKALGMPVEKRKTLPLQRLKIL